MSTVLCDFRGSLQPTNATSILHVQARQVRDVPDLNTTMAKLDHLPYEFLSSINAYAADWAALKGLLQVSQQVGEFFAGEFDSEADPEAIRLVESILMENPIMSHGLHRHFLMALKLRQPTLADPSLAHFMARDYSQLSLTSSSTTRGMLQEMVTVAANIQRLACVCLTTLLNRLHKVQPRRWEGYLDTDFKVFRVTGTAPYDLPDAGPPSWIEEYRVYRALWHLQLYSDLLVAADRLKWPQDDLEHLRTEHMDWSQLPAIAAEEIRSVSECLEDLLRAGTVQTTQPCVASSSSEMVLITKVPDATQLPGEFDVWSPPPIPKIPNHDATGIPIDIWGRGTKMVQGNRMVHLWRSWQIQSATHPARHQICSLQDARPWRALGMPIWDLWRFYGLGLWTAQRPRWLEPGPILTPDGSEISEGSDPPTHGQDIGYRFSSFIDARLQMERQERMRGQRQINQPENSA